jgi:hypothetical protein
LARRKNGVDFYDLARHPKPIFPSLDRGNCRTALLGAADAVAASCGRARLTCHEYGMPTKGSSHNTVLNRSNELLAFAQAFSLFQF